MDQGFGLLLSGLAAVGAVVVAVVTIVVTRRGQKDTNTITERFNEWQIMNDTVDTLRDNLADAQKEADRLRTDVSNARDEVTATRREMRKLRDELNVALANVGILSDHIRQHVPESVPWPRLRRVSNGS